MEPVIPLNSVGVIIGRFQVPNLHSGHEELIESVCQKHPTVIVLLGLSPLPNTFNNPLGYEERRQMITSAFPKVNVLYVRDQPSDEHWSQDVDGIVNAIIGPNQTAVLYGSRDSFIRYYSGSFQTFELEPSHKVSGTEIRRAVANENVDSEDFRRGKIAASFMRFPTAYQAVDVAIFTPDFTHILLGRKPRQTQFQLIGGFSDPVLSDTLEADAIREAYEETGVEVVIDQYLMSAKVNDWRYRGEVDCVRTVLFSAVTHDPANMMHGVRELGFQRRPDKELVETKWFDCEQISVSDSVREMHHPLIKSALRHAVNQRKK